MGNDRPLRGEGGICLMFLVLSIVATATSQMFPVWFSNKKADQKLRGDFFREERYWLIGRRKLINTTAKYIKLKGASCNITIILEYQCDSGTWFDCIMI